MPQLITKHPEIVLQILKDAHIKCGELIPAKILTNCPKENFCSLPTGELCIYGVKDIGQASQITSLDLLLTPQVLFPVALIIILLACFQLFLTSRK